MSITAGFLFAAVTLVVLIATRVNALPTAVSAGGTDVEFLEIIPGPGMSSLASLDLSSAQLYAMPAPGINVRTCHPTRPTEADTRLLARKFALHTDKDIAFGLNSIANCLNPFNPDPADAYDAREHAPSNCTVLNADVREIGRQDSAGGDGDLVSKVLVPYITAAEPWNGVASLGIAALSSHSRDCTATSSTSLLSIISATEKMESVVRNNKVAVDNQPLLTSLRCPLRARALFSSSSPTRRGAVVRHLKSTTLYTPPLCRTVIGAGQCQASPVSFNACLSIQRPPHSPFPTSLYVARAMSADDLSAPTISRRASGFSRMPASPLVGLESVPLCRASTYPESREPEAPSLVPLLVSYSWSIRTLPDLLLVSDMISDQIQLSEYSIWAEVEFALEASPLETLRSSLWLVTGTAIVSRLDPNGPEAVPMLVVPGFGYVDRFDAIHGDAAAFSWMLALIMRRGQGLAYFRPKFQCSQMSTRKPDGAWELISPETAVFDLDFRSDAAPAPQPNEDFASCALSQTLLDAAQLHRAM
ncbi:hypothetical protein JHW43_009107 [Diplocarpon mali]|nr:hypothetical protein JHW43_009107 [Diplocarpon mali]